MKRLIACLAFGSLTALSAVGTVSAQPSVGVSIGINQPGVYGRINIGDVPPPALVLPQPVVIAPPRERFERRPIYLYVPPSEQQSWGRYCSRYSACGQPVYFVREDWVRERYGREHPDWARGHADRGRYDHDHDHDRDQVRGRRDWHDDRRGPGRDHDRRD